MVWADHSRSGSRGGQGQDLDPRLQAVLGAQPGVAHRDQPVAVELRDGAAQPSSVTQVDLDVDRGRGQVRSSSAAAASGRAASVSADSRFHPSMPGGSCATAPLALTGLAWVEAREEVGHYPIGH